MKKYASNILITLFASSIIFHILVILGVFPMTIIWGGRITNRTELVQMETVSILINALFLVIILIKAGFVKINVNQKALNSTLGFMAFIFALNTVGNLFAKSSIETMIFTPVTAISAVLCVWLIWGK